MYVIATSPRLSLGKSTPAILAILSSPYISLGDLSTTTPPWPVPLLPVRAPAPPAQAPRGGVGRGASRAPPRDYPWRCLWRGFGQITLTTFLRRIILHFSHRNLIDGFTFISSSQPSAISHQLGLVSQAES